MIRWLVNKLTKKKPLCADLSNDGVELHICDHVGMWRLYTPYTHSAGMLSEGEALGFSGAYAWALREAALQDDLPVIEKLRYMVKSIEYEGYVINDDDDAPVWEPENMTKEI